MLPLDGLLWFPKERRESQKASGSNEPSQDSQIYRGQLEICSSYRNEGHSPDYAQDDN
jgi:hypothetical protein